MCCRLLVVYEVLQEIRPQGWYEERGVRLVACCVRTLCSRYRAETYFTSRTVTSYRIYLKLHTRSRKKRACYHCNCIWSENSMKLLDLSHASQTFPSTEFQICYHAHTDNFIGSNRNEYYLTKYTSKFQLFREIPFI